MAAFYAKSDILAEARRILREPTARMFSDTEINAWIDEAARRVSVLTLCNESSETETTGVVTSQPSVVLGSNFIKLEYVHVDSDTTDTDHSEVRGLQRISPQAIGHVCDGTAALPIFYCFFEDTVFVWPPADKTTYANLALYAQGYTMVDNYGSAASETLPNELQSVVLDYVLACAYCKDGRHSLAAEHMRRFMQNCMLARRDVYDEIVRVDSADSTQLPDYIVSPEGQIVR